MKLKQTGLIALTALALTNPVIADEVNDDNITTFEPGATLSSSAMNTTIGALVTAINDNAERIAAIEDTMAAGADVTGNSYCVISMGSSIFKLDVAAVDTNTFDPGDDTVDQGVFGAAVFGFSGGIVFNPDGTVDASVFDDAFDEVFANDHFDDPDYQRGAVDQWMWTQEGNNVNIIFQEPGEEDEIDPMTVDSSGSVLIFGVADNERSGDDSGDWYETVITIGVKVASIETCGGYVEPLEF